MLESEEVYFQLGAKVAVVETPGNWRNKFRRARGRRPYKFWELGRELSLPSWTPSRPRKLSSWLCLVSLSSSSTRFFLLNTLCHWPPPPPPLGENLFPWRCIAREKKDSVASCSPSRSHLHRAETIDNRTYIKEMKTYLRGELNSHVNRIGNWRHLSTFVSTYFVGLLTKYALCCFSSLLLPQGVNEIKLFSPPSFLCAA